ncbi:hypothetical protein E2320_003320 [Naja naja]|nr:hypothetical protein E2320_003320 [Naja naja]
MMSIFSSIGTLGMLYTYKLDMALPLDSYLIWDLDAQKLPLIPAKDAGEVLDKEPEKYDQEVPPVKNHHSLLVLEPQIITNVHRENAPPNDPKVEQCYFQINWPQALLQRWATEKANREKKLNLVFNQEQTIWNREPEAKKGDHQESTEMESPPQCSDD